VIFAYKRSNFLHGPLPLSIKLSVTMQQVTLRFRFGVVHFANFIVTFLFAYLIVFNLFDRFSTFQAWSYLILIFNVLSSVPLHIFPFLFFLHIKMLIISRRSTLVKKLLEMYNYDTRNCTSMVTIAVYRSNFISVSFVSNIRVCAL